MQSRLLRTSTVKNLASAYGEVTRTQAGKLVFLAGDDTDGRIEVLRGCADLVSSMTPKPTLLGGSFENGSYVAWQADSGAAETALSRLSSLLSLGETAASLGDLLIPDEVAQLLGQIMSKSKAALEIAADLISKPGAPGTPELLPRVLRRLCEEQPVVCLIDVGDETASGLWADLAALFARRLVLDMPVLLAFALDGPEELGPHEPDEPDALNVARQLTAVEVGVAEWQWLPPVTPHDLERWAGPVAREVVHSLLDITGGQGGWTASLWRDWKQRGVVEDQTGRWQFATNGRHQRLDDVDDSLGDRLRRAVDGDIGLISRAETILACGALEGQRFTAAAVAYALERNPDDVIDLIDDFLLADNSAAGGFVTEGEFVTIADERGERHLATYRFVRNLDRLALANHGLSPGERQLLGRRLADALRLEYGDQVRRVAPLLARLYEECGVTDQATYYQRMADGGATRDLLLWRARSFSGEAPTDHSERARRCQLLIGAAAEMQSSGPFREGLRFADAAAQIADRAADCGAAHSLAGVHLTHLAAYTKARRRCKKARAVFADLKATERELQVRLVLASISRAQSNFDQSKDELDEIAHLAAGSRHLYIRAAVHRGLAELAIQQGRFEEGRREGLAASQAFATLEDSPQRARALLCISLADIKQGYYEDAQERLNAAIETFRRCHETYAEAIARMGLVEVNRLLKKYPIARRECEAVLALLGKLGDRRGEAGAYLELGIVALSAGEADIGIRHLKTALQLSREQRDKYIEALAQHNLYIFDEGATDSDAEQVLRRHHALGNQEAEARIRLRLAYRHGLEGQSDQSHSEFDSILRFCSAEGDRHLKAYALYMRGMVYLRHSDPTCAERDLKEALELFAQLGDGRQEEVVLTALAGLSARPVGGALPDRPVNYDHTPSSPSPGSTQPTGENSNL